MSTGNANQNFKRLYSFRIEFKERNSRSYVYVLLIGLALVICALILLILRSLFKTEVFVTTLGVIIITILGVLFIIFGSVMRNRYFAEHGNITSNTIGQNVNNTNQSGNTIWNVTSHQNYDNTQSIENSLFHSSTAPIQQSDTHDQFNNNMPSPPPTYEESMRSNHTVVYVNPYR